MVSHGVDCKTALVSIILVCCCSPRDHVGVWFHRAHPLASG